MKVTDFVFRGNGITVTFDDNSTADLVNIVKNGKLETIGIKNNKQLEALKDFYNTLQYSEYDVRLSRSYNNVLEFNENGFVWAEKRLSTSSLTTGGANAPEFKIFAGQESIGSGLALQFGQGSDKGSNSSRVQITTADNALDDIATDQATYSVELWINPADLSDNKILIARNDWYIALNQAGKIQFGPNDTGSGITTGKVILAGAWVHVIVTHDAVNNVAAIYVNGSQQANGSVNATADNLTETMHIGAMFENISPIFKEYRGKIDAVRFYDGLLSTDEILYLYNGEEGIVNPVNGVGDLESDVLINFEFNETMGTTNGSPVLDTAGNATATLEGGSNPVPTQVEGAIGEVLNTGVFTFQFSGLIKNELFFSQEWPADAMIGEKPFFHVHWSPMSDNTGTVRWGIEFVSTGPVGSFTSDFTTIKYAETEITEPSNRKHIRTYWEPLLDILQVGGSMAVCRVFRDAENDTYPDDVSLLAVDFDYKKNQIGQQNNDILDVLDELYS